ncbi:hypothetical protein AFAEC_0825 [Aliarcobacter faecis]|uniref:DUF3800 domain-containing protein n=1 Tax=Aliarcobacter faecis TaxID=1564138 RepID=UPI00047D678C|nr:DUF3800 domain-containing protein [Aliarcobacter faecis]QKF73000.1 hypothetical protein AFAEC_0825 [Aliarcobacter faecis]
MTENIKIIQNILKKQNKYDLAIKLENAVYKDHLIDGWNGGIGEIEISINPNYFLELETIDDDSRNMLIKLFNALPHDYYEINSIRFSINTQVNIETISDTIYIFVDEAGDFDFSSNGSKHYLFTFLVKKRPFNLHEYIASYRYSLLERNLDPLVEKRLDIEAFHACEDNNYIKNELFNIISTFDENSVKAYSYILEKPKVNPEKRNHKDRFYIDNLSFAIQKLLGELNINKNFIIITDRLPVQSNKNKQIGALKKGIKEYLKSKNLDKQLRYDIFHHCSASSTNLQIADYICWAIFRKFERNDETYYKRIEKYLIKVDEMTKDRKEVYYEK